LQHNFGVFTSVIAGVWAGGVLCLLFYMKTNYLLIKNFLPMKNFLLSLVAIFTFCCFNLVNAQGCQDCADAAGFYCGDDTSNWTSYSPDGCVPSYYLGDGWDDCVDGGDEAGVATTDCPAALSDVTLTLSDSYGDGGGSVTIDETTYTLESGSSNSWTLSVDLSVCTDVVYAATDSWPSENSWSVSDSDGNVLASMGNMSGSFGACGTPGCMDANADNYNADAAVEDGSCTYSCPYLADGSLYTEGTYTCYDYVWNLMYYNVEQMIGYGYDCSCVTDPVVGCLDPDADNYDADADIDGGCTYTCAVATVTMIDSWGDGWNGNVLTIGSETFELPAGSSATGCLSSLDCQTWTLGGGSYIGETSFTVSDADGNEIYAAEGSTGSGLVGNCVTDCMDEAAENYNAEADIADNAMCTYAAVQGCMDSDACNYDSAAEEDNGSCVYAPAGTNCDGSCAAGYMEIVATFSDSWGDG